MDQQGTGEPGAGVPDKTDDKAAGNDARLAHFIRLLSDDDAVSRWKAAEALGRIGNGEAVEELISTLRDEDARVRLKAAWALGQIGDPRAIAPLQRLYRIEDEWVQEIITKALENIQRGMSRR